MLLDVAMVMVLARERPIAYIAHKLGWSVYSFLVPYAILLPREGFPTILNGANVTF
jgi:hypothetical protein